METGLEKANASSASSPAASPGLLLVNPVPTLVV